MIHLILFAISAANAAILAASPTGPSAPLAAAGLVFSFGLGLASAIRRGGRAAPWGT